MSCYVVGGDVTVSDSVACSKGYDSGGDYRVAENGSASRTLLLACTGDISDSCFPSVVSYLHSSPAASSMMMTF